MGQLNAVEINLVVIWDTVQDHTGLYSGRPIWDPVGFYSAALSCLLMPFPPLEDDELHQ